MRVPQYPECLCFWSLVKFSSSSMYTGKFWNVCALSMHSLIYVALAGESWWTTLRLMLHPRDTILTVCLDLSNSNRNGWISLYWCSVIFICENNNVFKTMFLQTTEIRNQIFTENGLTKLLHKFYSIWIENTNLLFTLCLIN